MIKSTPIKCPNCGCATWELLKMTDDEDPKWTALQFKCSDGCFIDLFAMSYLPIEDIFKVIEAEG